MSSTKRKLTREQWSLDNPDCMVPGCRESVVYGNIIDTHEIIGGADRQKALMMPALWMRYCRTHHDQTGSRPTQEWLVRQLAWKQYADSDNYDGETVIRMWRPKCMPELVTEVLEAVNAEWRKIIREFA